MLFGSYHWQIYISSLEETDFQWVDKQVEGPELENESFKSYENWKNSVCHNLPNAFGIDNSMCHNGMLYHSERLKETDTEKTMKGNYPIWNCALWISNSYGQIVLFFFPIPYCL